MQIEEEKRPFFLPKSDKSLLPNQMKSIFRLNVPISAKFDNKTKLCSKSDFEVRAR